MSGESLTTKRRSKPFYRPSAPRPGRATAQTAATGLFLGERTTKFAPAPSPDGPSSPAALGLGQTFNYSFFVFSPTCANSASVFFVLHNSFYSRFYARQHICYSAYMLSPVRLSVRPSVCHTGVSQIGVNIPKER